MLNNTEGWVWDTVKTFQDNLDEWKRQCLILGKTPREKTEVIDQRRSGIWQSRIIKDYKNRTLSKERIDILNNTLWWKWKSV